MASYADRFKQREEQLPLAYAAIEPLRDICPSVREVFTGVADSTGIELVKPASVTFFMDGNRLKFLIRPKLQGEVGWGVISDCRRPFECIELALQNGEVDWKSDKFNQSNSTEEPSF